MTFFPSVGKKIKSTRNARSNTVVREIFVINKFSSVPYDDKNYQHRIIRTKLHFRYAEAMKIKQRKNLIDEYFYKRKFPDLRYLTPLQLLVCTAYNGMLIEHCTSE